MQGGYFRCQCVLVDWLMNLVNPQFDPKDQITWHSVATSTFHWLETCTKFSEEKEEFEQQKGRKGVTLNDLEQATQNIWKDWLKADEIAQKRVKAKQAATSDLPSKCKEAQHLCEQQAKITGLNTPTKSGD